MLKSGIIFGLIGFVLVLGVSVLISPFCSICFTVLLGLGAGYVAGVFERPLDSGEAWKRGAGAGALAGGLVILGQLIAGGVNANFMANDPNAQIVNELLGLPPADPAMLWLGAVFAACCFGLVNVGILAGLGAAGGALWGNMNTTNGGGPGPAEPIPPAA
jgi:hypothetical protein